MIDAKGKEVGAEVLEGGLARPLGEYARLPTPQVGIQAMGALDKVLTKLVYIGILAVAGLLIYKLVGRKG